MIQKGVRIKQQLDIEEGPDAALEQSFADTLAARIKKMGYGFSTRTLKWILVNLLAAAVHILSLLVSAIVTLISIIFGAILAAIGPVILVVVCVASVFAFLFVDETNVADTSDPAYIDNCISALLADYRNSVVEDYVNETYTFGASYLQYDVCFDLRGRVTSHIHDLVSYGREDDVMEDKYIKARKKAAADIINGYFGKKSGYRQEFMEDVKMVYFAKMYAEDHVAVTAGADSSGQTTPYLMIDTKKETDTLTEVFNEFCTADVDLETHPSWAKSNRPWPYRLNGDRLLDSQLQIYETRADTVTVRLKTMEAYLKAFPLTSEEQAHYDEFTRIREKH